MQLSKLTNTHILLQKKIFKEFGMVRFFHIKKYVNAYYIFIIII